MFKISYAITTHNEGNYIKMLLDSILNCNIDYDFEIIILDDMSDDKFTVDILKLYSNYNNVYIYYSKFNNNFAAHKNLLNSYCSGDYILNIDADERLDKYFIENIQYILEANSNIELFWFPRTNIVYSITDNHIRQWKWTISTVDWLSQPVVNFPDWQGRLYKNLPSKIKWHRKVHEVIDGAETFSYLPTTKEYCIMHEKTIHRQEQQNKFYKEMN